MSTEPFQLPSPTFKPKLGCETARSIYTQYEDWFNKNHRVQFAYDWVQVLVDLVSHLLASKIGLDVFFIRVLFLLDWGRYLMRVHVLFYSILKSSICIMFSIMYGPNEDIKLAFFDLIWEKKLMPFRKVCYQVLSLSQSQLPAYHFKCFNWNKHRKALESFNFGADISGMILTYTYSSNWRFIRWLNWFVSRSRVIKKCYCGHYLLERYFFQLVLDGSFDAISDCKQQLAVANVFELTVQKLRGHCSFIRLMKETNINLVMNLSFVKQVCYESSIHHLIEAFKWCYGRGGVEDFDFFVTSRYPPHLFSTQQYSQLLQEKVSFMYEYFKTDINIQFAAYLELMEEMIHLLRSYLVKKRNYKECFEAVKNVWSSSQLVFSNEEQLQLFLLVHPSEENTYLFKMQCIVSRCERAGIKF